MSLEPMIDPVEPVLKKPRDREDFVFNPFTGNFDVVKIFNEDRIVTSEYNEGGHLNMIWDQVSQTFIELGFLVVTTDKGNVVVV